VSSRAALSIRVLGSHSTSWMTHNSRFDGVARVVDVGARTDPAPAQTHGRSRFHGSGLRAMLESATSFRDDVVDGRFVIETRHRRHAWEVVVEPDSRELLLVVVTAYPVEGRQQ